MELISDLKTKQELDGFLFFLDKVRISTASKLEETNSSYLKILKKTIPDVDVTARKDAKSKLKLKTLKESLEETKVLEVYLPFKPSVKFVNKVFVWVESQLSFPLVLDFHLSSITSVGGFFVLDGKSYNFSLEKALTSYQFDLETTNE